MIGSLTAVLTAPAPAGESYCRPHSSSVKAIWIPAFAGMTVTRRKLPSFPRRRESIDLRPRPSSRLRTPITDAARSDVRDSVRWSTKRDLVPHHLRPARPRRPGRSLPQSLLPQGHPRRGAGAHRSGRAARGARRRLSRAPVPAQGVRDQHADLEARDRAARAAFGDHQGSPARRRRRGVPRPGRGDRRGGRDGRPGAGRQDLPRVRACGDAGREACGRGALGRSRLQHGEPAGRTREVHRRREPDARRGPRPERPPARIGLPHPPGSDPVPRARREQRVQRARHAASRRDHRDQQEGTRRDRVGRRGLGAPEPARRHQAQAAPLTGGGGGDDRAAARDRDRAGREPGRHRGTAVRVGAPSRGGAYRARARGAPV